MCRWWGGGRRVLAVVSLRDGGWGSEEREMRTKLPVASLLRCWPFECTISWVIDAASLSLASNDVSAIGTVKRVPNACVAEKC